MYTKEDKRRWLILQCRYYKGETTPPKTLPENYALMWDYEMRWVEWTLEDNAMIEAFKEDVKRYHLENKDGDTTPLTLKALLFDRFLHWSQYATLKEGLKNFEQWYKAHYLLWKTNRERRAEKRRQELIPKCTRYHGESVCPYNPDFDVTIWHWEKEWVEALADSYSNRERFFKELMATPCLNARPLPYWKKQAHNYGMPATLLACMAKNFGKGYKGQFTHEMQDYFELFLHSYKKK